MQNFTAVIPRYSGIQDAPLSIAHLDSQESSEEGESNPEMQTVTISITLVEKDKKNESQQYDLAQKK